MRKPTSPIHVAGGVLAGYSLWLNAAVGLALIVSFGAFEFWQEHRSQDTGALDFLEFIIGLFIGSGIGLIVHETPRLIISSMIMG